MLKPHLVKKCGMRTTLAMPSLTFLTTSLLAGWDGYYAFFSNQSFFVVYDKAGEKIKSSAWNFWEYQFSDLVAPEWSGIGFLYPSDSGFSGWTLPECKK
ncbi:TPA: hypothetical protein ACXRZR_004178 [Klebsiella variicola subsp. variicola]|uniref:hypothetical protein n=1 Tax=Klebsiella variicola TaxID=244366 RepID=UPI003004C983